MGVVHSNWIPTLSYTRHLSPGPTSFCILMSSAVGWLAMFLCLCLCLCLSLCCCCSASTSAPPPTPHPRKAMRRLTEECGATSSYPRTAIVPRVLARQARCRVSPPPPPATSLVALSLARPAHPASPARCHSLTLTSTPGVLAASSLLASVHHTAAAD